MKKLILSLIFLIIFTLVLNAQPGGGDPGGGGKPGDNPVPIGGVELLLLVGGALGARKMLKKK